MADKKRRTTATVSTISVTDAAVAERAYQRWIARGRPETDGREDWFAARNELLAETQKPAVPRARAGKRKTQVSEVKASALPPHTVLN